MQVRKKYKFVGRVLDFVSTSPVQPIQTGMFWEGSKKVFNEKFLVFEP